MFYLARTSVDISAQNCLRRTWGSVFLVVVVVALSGCDPNTKTGEIETAKPDVSNVPLRIWIASKVSDSQRINRQWQAVSDQPIEISSITVDDLLAGEACECDILLYPSRLIGELAEREWISKLSKADLAQTNEEFAYVSAAADNQTKLGQTQYGIALGCSVPCVIASDLLGAELAESEVTWERLLSSSTQVQVSDDSSGTAVDDDAVVDRFLAILATLTTRSPRYGLLFEMQSMQSRFEEPESARACEILKAMFAQPNGTTLAAGAHADAWKAIATSEDKVFTIVPPTSLDADTAKIKGGTPLRISVQGDTFGWNTGSGISASLSTACRQSSRAKEFLNWARESKSLDALSDVVEGVDSASPVTGPESTSWQTRQALRSAYAQDGLPREPSLPGSERYRAALATALRALLAGEKTPNEAMKGAHEDWGNISQENQLGLRDAYEKSLGLGF